MLLAVIGLDRILPFAPSVGTLAAIVLVLFLARRVLERRRLAGRGRQIQHQLIMLVLTLTGLLLLVLVLPLGDSVRGQVLTLVGILLSAAIALSSTTFVGNAMAGIMLRTVRNFRVGDFVRVGDHFGRVSERGLFHTEIQNEDRDLTTLPNLFLVSHPVTVVRSSGTILSATVSLGYDAPRSTIEPLLLRAGADAGLADPFVQVLELGDFSVTYRLAGLLTEVKQILSCRSRLRMAMLDRLHEGGVEIVSPSFMNTRAFAPEDRFIPAAPVAVAPRSDHATSHEDLAFDKAEEAESLERLEQRLAEYAAQIDARKKAAGDAEDDAGREAIQHEVARLEARRDAVAALIETRRKRSDS
jgi:small-conductance mechanosensitive channel